MQVILAKKTVVFDDTLQEFGFDHTGRLYYVLKDSPDVEIDMYQAKDEKVAKGLYDKITHRMYLKSPSCLLKDETD